MHREYPDSEYREEVYLLLGHFCIGIKMQYPGIGSDRRKFPAVWDVPD